MEEAKRSPHKSPELQALIDKKEGESAKRKVEESSRRHSQVSNYSKISKQNN